MHWEVELHTKEVYDMWINAGATPEQIALDYIGKYRGIFYKSKPQYFGDSVLASCHGMNLNIDWGGDFTSIMLTPSQYYTLHNMYMRLENLSTKEAEIYKEVLDTSAKLFYALCKLNNYIKDKP